MGISKMRKNFTQSNLKDSGMCNQPLPARIEALLFITPSLFYTKSCIQRTTSVLLRQFTNNIQNFFNNTFADILLLLLEKERKKSFQFTQSFACTRNSQKKLTKHGSQVYFLTKFQLENIYKWPLFSGFGCFNQLIKGSEPQK